MADFVDSSNQWKREFFAHLLPVQMQVLMIMASYPPPSRGGATLGHKEATAPLTFYKHILCAEI